MKKIVLTILFFVLLYSIPVHAKNEVILTEEEISWLNSRNNTVIVYPEKNYPPFSYDSSIGVAQGLSYDFLNIISQKVGFKIEYLPSQSLYQILEEVKNSNKGDVVTSLSYNKERSGYLNFSDVYVSIPAVIVTRKDSTQSIRTLEDLSGRKVAIGSKYAVEDFVRNANPRVIIEPVVDDQLGLQKLILGEVEATVLDVASLSYYLSKQVLSSVRVSGNVGFNYELSFATPKDKIILISILNKGLAQISADERSTIFDKWINIESDNNKYNFFYSFLHSAESMIIIYVLIFLGMLSSALYFLYRLSRDSKFKMESHSIEEAIHSLKASNENIVEELKSIKRDEDRLEERIDSLKK